MSLTISKPAGRRRARMTLKRRITDVSYKHHIESPADWGRHRAMNRDDKLRYIAHRVQAIRELAGSRAA